LPGQVKWAVAGAATVNDEEHVKVAEQSFVYVQVTVVVPPQNEGATGVTGFVVNIPLHPPPEAIEPSHVANLLLIAAWVWQESSF
jgi:hypothetical protein